MVAVADAGEFIPRFAAVLGDHGERVRHGEPVRIAVVLGGLTTVAAARFGGVGQAQADGDVRDDAGDDDSATPVGRPAAAGGIGVNRLV
ncbi:MULTISPECIES: hypothetical protein [unclassified Actinoplanes]|uniref:hypothetical protein n=1 Tax=unclassified Actinoplanes TaxID=2626549 RepID=UPI0005BD2213|nr:MULTISPECIES: hypothetical protein [unclassified Actinoplanes]